MPTRIWRGSGEREHTAMLEEMGAAVAHQLQNPLSAVKARVQLGLRNPAEGPSHRGLADEGPRRGLPGRGYNAPYSKPGGGRVQGRAQDYMTVGIVHFMAFPQTMGGSGPIAETVGKIAEDPFFTGIEISTAAGVCGVLHLLVLGELPQRGLVKLEQVSYDRFMDTPFGRYYARAGQAGRHGE